MTRARKNEKKNMKKAMFPKKPFICTNCKELTDFGHYIPPAMREEGEWFCKEKQDKIDNI